MYAIRLADPCCQIISPLNWVRLTRSKPAQVQELSKKYGIPYKIIAKKRVRYRLACFCKHPDAFRKVFLQDSLY